MQNRVDTKKWDGNIVNFTNKAAKLYDNFQRIYLLLGLCLISKLAIAQIGFTIESPAVKEFCEAQKYAVTIEFGQENASSEILVSFLFNQEVALIGSTLDANIEIISATEINVNVDEFAACSFLSFDVWVNPSCTSNLPNLELQANLLVNDQIVSSQEQSAFIKRVQFFLEFSDYEFDTENNLLYKDILITNTGTASISNFLVDVDIDQNFATLNPQSDGIIVAENQLLIDSDILKTEGIASGSLSPGEEIEFSVVFELNSCDLRSISYQIYPECALSDCESKQLFVDENAIYASNLQIVTPEETFFSYGVCEAFSNEIVIKNISEESGSSLASAYDLSFVLQPLSVSTLYEDCYINTYSINNRNIEFTIENRNTTLDFSKITTDIDGIGGLSDLDFDGIFDDLAIGDSIVISQNITLDPSCLNRRNSAILSNILSLNYTNFCGQEEQVSSDVGISNSNYLSAVSIKAEDIKKDLSGDRFVAEGEQLNWNFSIITIDNQVNPCPSESVQIFVYIPPNLRFLETEKSYYISNREDTLTPSITIFQDSLLITFEHKRYSEIVLPFEGQCVLSDIAAYDPNLALCEQCFDYPFYRLTTKLVQNCTAYTCGPEILPSETISVPFKTVCSGVSDTDSAIKKGEVTVQRLNGGWADINRTQLWADVAKSSSQNHRYFFDHDTIKISVPYQFLCATGSNAFSFYLRELSFGWDFELALLASNNLVYNRMDGELISTCNVNQVTTNQNTIIHFQADDSWVNNSCISKQDSNVWEIVAQVRFNSDQDVGARDYVTQPFQSYIIEEFQNCSKLSNRSTDTIFVSEVFREDKFNAFGINDLALLFGLDIYSENYIGSSIYGNNITKKLANTGDFEAEFREFPVIRNLEYNIPKGYEIKNAELVIAKYKAGLNSGFILDQPLDTLRILQGTVSNVNATSTSYQFEDSSDLLYQNTLEENLVAVAVLKSVCLPNEPPEPITASGTLQYKDYYEGSHDIKNYNFFTSRFAPFIPFLYKMNDDFQLLGDSNSSIWILENQDITSLQFDFGNEISPDESNFYLRYSSTKSKIDSVQVQLAEDLENENLFTDFQAIKLTDELFELRDPFYSANRIDNFFAFDKINPDFVFYTSDHACGFDTLIYEIGPIRLFDPGECSELIFRDTIVTFREAGKPHIELIDALTEINPCGINELQISIQNLGNGSLVDNSIFIVSPLISTAQVSFHKNNLAPIELSSEIVSIQDTLLLNLNQSELDTIFGLQNRDSLTITLAFEIDCSNDGFFDAEFGMRSKSLCATEHEIAKLNMTNLPIMLPDSEPKSIQLRSVSTAPCNNEFHLEVNIPNIDEFPKTNDSLVLIISPSLEYRSNSSFLNGQAIEDPQVRFNEGFLELAWVNILENINETEALVRITLQSTCEDICRAETFAANYYTEDVFDCDQNNTNCVTRVLQAEAKSTALNLRSDYTIANPLLTLDSINGEQFFIQLSYMLTDRNEHQYEGNIFSTIYLDENMDGQFSTNETIISADELNAQDLLTTDNQIVQCFSVSPDQVCNLNLNIALSENCQCEPINTSLQLNQELILNSSIFSCATEAIDLSPYESEFCTSAWESHPNIEIIEEKYVYTPAFDPNENTLLDSIFLNLDCGSCSIRNRFELQITNGLDAENIGFNEVIEICNKESTVLSPLIDADEYLWNTGETSKEITVSDPDIYWLEIKIDSCSVRDSVEVIHRDFTIDLGRDTSICEGENLVLSSPNSSLNLWSNNSTEQSIEVEESGVYWLEASNENCVFRDSINVLFEACEAALCPVYVPNVISNNTNSANANFQIFSPCPLQNYKLEIFSRWGEKVFSSSNIEDIWTGDYQNSKLDIGVYMVKLSYQLEEQSKPRVEFSNITIVR